MKHHHKDFQLKKYILKILYPYFLGAQRGFYIYTDKHQKEIIKIVLEG